MPEELGVLRRLIDSWRGRGLPPIVRRLAGASFFQDLASEMVYPLLPGFFAGLGGGAALLGAMESAAEGALALVKGAAGRWSDRARRRKPFVAAGYGMSAIARPLLAAVALPWQVTALRVWDRIAKGLRTAPRDAMIAEASPAGGRAYAFAFHRGLDHLGAAVGPLAAAAILLAAPGRERWVFALATLPALAGFATVALGTREAPRSAPTDIEHATERAATRLPPRLLAALAAFALFALGNASDAFLLLRAGDLGVPALGLTLLWSAFHVAKSALSAPAGRLADRLGRRRSILAGWAIYAVAYAGFAFAESRGQVFAWMGVYALHFALVEGAERALVLELAGAQIGAGSSLGAYHAATGFAAFAASVGFGILWQFASPRVAFLAGAALAGGAAILLAAAGRAPQR
ncbi:MAG: MFS transporter [Thermoanaerobaculia bacterium]